MNKFFMLYREGGREPTFKHSTDEAAKREAERIAREHGGPVYLLEAVAKVEVKWESWTTSAPVVLPSTVTVARFPGEWVDFDIGWSEMRTEIHKHPTLRLAGTNSDPDVEVGYAGSGCIVRALTEFGADWLTQRKERAQSNGPPTQEQAKAHAAKHGLDGGTLGRWLVCLETSAPVVLCLDHFGVVASSVEIGLVNMSAGAIGGKWFPLAADGSPLSAKDAHDDLPF